LRRDFIYLSASLNLPHGWGGGEEPRREATRGVENTKENGKAAAPNPLRTFHGAAAGPGRQRLAGAVAPLPGSWRERKKEREGAGRQGRRRWAWWGGSLVWWGTRCSVGAEFGWWTARTDQSGTDGPWAKRRGGGLQAARVVGTWGGVGFGSRDAPPGALAEGARRGSVS